MAREYDHLFKLLIIGDSGKELVPGAFTEQGRALYLGVVNGALEHGAQVRVPLRVERLNNERSVALFLMNLVVDQRAVGWSSLHCYYHAHVS